MKRIHPQTVQRHAIAIAALAALISPTQAADWEISGFLRQELAYKITDDQNPTNQGSSFKNAGKQVEFGGLDFGGFYGASAAPYLNRNGAAAGSCGTASVAGLAGGDGCKLSHPTESVRKIDTNWFATRLDLNIDGKVNEKLKATIKIRGIFDETKDLEKDSHGYNISLAPSATTPRFAANETYSTKTGDILSGSSFKQKFGGTAGGPLAYATDRMSVDLPAFYLDYNDGPLWVRAGNQQIAWGEALFFRVADQVNGLDLRGHLFGVAAEEYSDTRRSALGLRMNYRVNEKMDIDTYVQKFSPTLVPQGETPYGLIPDAFTIDEKPGYDSAKNKLNAGFRVKGEAGGFGYQAFAMSRVDPNGVYTWSSAAQGATFAGDNTNLSPLAGAYVGTAATNTNTGVWSFNDWARGAVYARLNPIEGVGTFASFNPAGNGAVDLCGLALGGVSGAAGAYNITKNETAKCVVDTFAALGPVRGWLSREYKRESIFGGGVNRVFEGEPDSFLDQLIGRFEFSYTPNKKFTNSTLGNYIEANEYQFAFIAEKYHKFVSSFPATYFVLQWLHKSESDLFGRHLSGYDQRNMYNYLNIDQSTVAGVAAAKAYAASNRLSPAGKRGGFNAVALALQQPSPTLEYRFDFAVLTDGNGGWYSQPGMKWKPTKNVQVDTYLNLVYSQHKGESRDFADGLQHNNEIFARVAYQF